MSVFAEQKRFKKLSLCA